MTLVLGRPIEEVRRLIERATDTEAAIIHAALEEELHDWTRYARPKQLPPPGDWLIWLLITGRRWGKTRTAAQWLRTRALETVGTYGICAPTYGSVRDVCVEGGDAAHPSGFLSVCKADEIVDYKKTTGVLYLRNGSRIYMLSADEPDVNRGYGFEAVWCDEFSSWRYPAMWHEVLLPATTVADKHRFVITTTPKPNRLTVELAERAKTDDTIELVRGHTRENVANLGRGAVEELERTMTARLARQELAGEILTDTPGALWRIDTIKSVDDYPDLSRLVISVDPAVTSDETSDETGIVCVGRAGANAYVLEDHSGRYDPHSAMSKVAELFHELAADKVVVERNNGGDYLPALLATIDPHIPVELVWAKRGKELRAQPVAGLYEHSRVFHVGTLAELESQMCTWAPGSNDSPDRLDALVYGVTALFPELAHGERTLRYRGAA